MIETILAIIGAIGLGITIVAIGLIIADLLYFRWR